ncbi:MAG: flagellar assembly protein FliW [Acidobacteriaceae bacterium]|nr:flagellar assembly protein FliW [Acidobacteriaceae bacterium]
MPTCQTKFHGPIAYEPDQVLKVPAGLFGFAGETEFLLLELPSARPIAFVQSVHTPALCFISLPAQVVDPAYRLALKAEDIKALGYTPDAPPAMGKEVLCLALLMVEPEQPTTANLLAPLIIDIARHRGRQVIVNAPYSHRSPVAPEGLKRAC